jgi:hypothetical protein
MVEESWQHCESGQWNPGQSSQLQGSAYISTVFTVNKEGLFMSQLEKYVFHRRDSYIVSWRLLRFVLLNYL